MYIKIPCANIRVVNVVKLQLYCSILIQNKGDLMLKNNLKSLCFHIALCFTYFLGYVIQMSYFGVTEWVDVKAYESHMIKLVILAIVLTILASFLYYFFARKFLEDQGSLLKNLVSVSSVSIFCILLWLLVYPAAQLEVFSKLNLWSVYALFIGFATFIVESIDGDIPIILLISAFLPSLMMGVSIKKIK